MGHLPLYLTGKAMIKLRRGDDLSFKIPVVDAAGQPYVITGHTFGMQVRLHPSFDDALVTFPVGYFEVDPENNTILLVKGSYDLFDDLTPDVTYYFDVQLTTPQSVVYTIVPPTKFKIEWDVTR